MAKLPEHCEKAKCSWHRIWLQKFKYDDGSFLFYYIYTI